MSRFAYQYRRSLNIGQKMRNGNEFANVDAFGIKLITKITVLISLATPTFHIVTAEMSHTLDFIKNILNLGGI